MALLFKTTYSQTDVFKIRGTTSVDGNVFIFYVEGNNRILDSMKVDNGKFEFKGSLNLREVCESLR